jgi:hypothetical protein
MYNVASAWQDNITHKFEDSGSYNKIWLDIATPSTLQPRLCTFRLPPLQSPKNAVHGLQFKTDDYVINSVRTWLHEQDKKWYQ